MRGGKKRLQGLERRPLVEDAAVQEVVGEGEVAELVDGQVPGDLALERDRGGPEERQRRASPDERLGRTSSGARSIRWSRRVSAWSAWPRRRVGSTAAGGRLAARAIGLAGHGPRIAKPPPERKARRCRVARPDARTRTGCERRRGRAVLAAGRGGGSPSASARRRRRRRRAGRRSPPARDTLIAAPTGSGKTLAAFLWSIDRLLAARRGRHARGPDRRRLRLAAEGARQRHPEEPRAAARRAPRARRRRGRAAARDPRRGAHRRHAGERAPGDGAPAAAHPHHHAGVALHPAHRREAADACSPAPRR